MKNLFGILPFRIRTKIGLLVVLLVILLISSVTVIYMHSARKRVQKDLQDRTATLTRVLGIMTVQALKEGDFSRLRKALDNLVEVEESDIITISITKVSETTGEEIEVAAARNTRFNNRAVPSWKPEKNQPITGPAGVVGYIHTEFSLKRFTATMHELRNYYLMLMGGFIFLGIIASIVLSRLITRPIENLEKTAQIVSRGELNVEASVASKDELGQLARTFNEMILGLKQIEKARKYLSHSAWLEVQKSAGTKLYLGGESRDVTVLFADICDFTSISSRFPPHEVVSILNDYFGVVVDTIVKHHGVLDKFMGDCAMAVFFSSSIEDSARNAVFCAMEIQEKMIELSRTRFMYQKVTVEVGIGINSGRVVSGNVGSRQRMEYTVIGDTVNVASRLEKLAKKGKYSRILTGMETRDLLQELVDFEELPPTSLKGKSEQVPVYEVKQLKGLEAILENFKSDNLELKKNSIDVLGRSKNPSALTPLLAFLNDPDPAIRMAVTSALSRLSDLPLAADTGTSLKTNLVRAVTTEQDKKVLATLVQALGFIGDAQHENLLASFLDNPDARVRANAIEALLNTGAPSIVAMVQPLIDDINNRVKANAAIALWRNGEYGVIDKLAQMLRNPRMLMRASAVFALGELGTVKSMEMLINVLKDENQEIFFNVFEAIQKTVDTLISSLHDPNREVKMQAVKALGKIGDKKALLPLMKLLYSADVMMAEMILESIEMIGVPKEMILLMEKYQKNQQISS